MNLTSDPLFVRAEMDYRRERALGMVGGRTGPGLRRRLADCWLRATTPAHTQVQGTPRTLGAVPAQSATEVAEPCLDGLRRAG